MESPEGTTAPEAPEPRERSGRGIGRARGVGKRMVALGLIVGLGIVGLSVWARSRPSVASPPGRTFVRRLPAPLEAYPDDESLGAVARAQMREARPPDHRPLVRISWSGSGDTRRWNEISIDPRGRVEAVRHLWNDSIRRARGSGPDRPVPPGSLQALLDRLGPSVAAPPIEDLLIVSFPRNGRWTTRIYDRTALPSEIPALWRAVDPRPPRPGRRAPWGG